MLFTFNDSERPWTNKMSSHSKRAYAGVCRAFLSWSMTEIRSTLSPLLHLSFHLLSVASPPSIHFLHQAAISHSVRLTLGPIRSALLPLSLLLSSFSLCRAVSADSSGRDKVLMPGLKVTAPVLQPHSWGARDPSPHGTPRAARREGESRTDGRRRGCESKRAGGRRIIGRRTATHSANQNMPHHRSMSAPAKRMSKPACTHINYLEKNIFFLACTLC